MNSPARSRCRSLLSVSAPWRHTALGLIALGLLGVACGDEDRTHVGPAATPEVDHNASVRVDADRIVGTLDGAVINAQIPIEALSTGEGAVVVSLRSVNDSEVFANVNVPYSLRAGETTTLSARLALPEPPTEQAGLVGYNVVVRAQGALRVARSLLHVIPAVELQLEGPKRLRAGKDASYRVTARDPRTWGALPNTRVTLNLSSEGAAAESHELVTDAAGSATLSLSVPAAGTYALAAASASSGVSATVADAVEVQAATQRVLLTTDKPIYKPGQTIHLRALSLAQSDRHPNAGADVTLEIDDGKGNKIFKRTLQTDAHGIVSSDFVLGSVLNQGTFKVRAIAADTTSEKTVDVYEYALPKFELGVRTDKDWYLAGESVSLDLDARYFFGKPVANATVEVELLAIVTGETLVGRVQSRTDAEGRLQTSVRLPDALPGLDINSGNALAFLRITATDGAGQSVSKEHALSVAAEPVRVTLVPESAQVVPGFDNHLDLFVTDPLGAPIANAQAEVRVADVTHSVVTDAFGQARVEWNPAPGAGDARAVIEVGGRQVTKTVTFDSQAGQEHVLVRTDRAVYDAGEDVSVEILTDGAGPVYVDWVNDGQAVDMRTLTPTDGVARFTVPLDTSLLGENRVQAYIVDDDGNVVRSSRTLFGRGGGRLTISMSSDQERYAPGAPATLTFNVTDETGAPAVAALGVQIVDEAVFSVSDARPGLLSTYFQLEDEFAKPTYQIEAPGGDLGDLLLTQTAVSDAPARAAAQVRAAANLAALGSSPLLGLSKSSWTEVLERSRALLAPIMEAQKPELYDLARGAAKAGATALADRGCRAVDYYCSGLGKTFVEALQEELADRFEGYDFWGQAYAVNAGTGLQVPFISAGPDERMGTNDDMTVNLDLLQLGVTFPTGSALPVGNVGGGAGGGGGFPVDEAEQAPATPDLDNPNPSPGEATSSPRVRRDFPETLYVNPSLITDASGTASVTLDMADSITAWRVSALGNTTSGLLGGATSALTVFQDFFVDVSFPATLTRGDEVSFPIAVYNYLDTPQTVSLALDAADWYTALGDTTLSLDLAPGEVRGVSVPVRVEQVGLETLTVSAQGARAADAVARSVRVVPDGKALSSARSGSLAPGDVAHAVSFPAEVVPGSEQLYLNVYPAFVAQAVSGMDSILQVPSGCFEQTTSTAWPNVLVTRYMRATGQVTPEIQLRAESLISAGYQRLLTFEHPGGGFSWFGTQDPAPYLSVTAFGLMEFADMKAVQEVDAAMLARTEAWLVSQQAGDGSWTGDQSEFFSFHTSTVRNTAFVLWALAENGYQGPAAERGLAYVKANLDQGGSESDDPYTLALVANAMVLLDDPAAGEILARLDALKRVEGDKTSWGTTLQTNFYGSGDDADVSATALVAHALLRANAYPEDVQGALAYITAAKDPAGNFGSTQATTWSLKALMLAASRGTEGAAGTLSVSVDGDDFAQVELRADQSDVMTTVDMSALATTGEHEVALSFLGTGRVSYNLVSTHNVPWSAISPEPTGPVAISVAYDQTTLAVDDSVRATARIENLTDQTTNMVLVTLGVPPGFEVEMADFQQYLDQGVLSRAERTGKQLNLYVSELAAGQSLSFEYSLVATLPVRASDGGAEVSLYYEPDQKSQAPATTLIATE